MRNSLAVRLVQRAGNLDRKPQRLIQRQRSLLQPLAQRLAIEVFHDEKIRVLLTADIVEHADVGMIHAGHGARFAFKPLAQFGVAREVRRQNSDGDRAVEPRVSRFVDFALYRPLR